jgi:uncharacterized protein YqgC (DUF456 family)
MLFVAVAIAMLIGMIGIVAPFFPGLTVMWLAALAYGLIGNTYRFRRECAGSARLRVRHHRHVVGLGAG